MRWKCDLAGQINAITPEEIKLVLGEYQTSASRPGKLSVRELNDDDCPDTRSFVFKLARSTADTAVDQEFSSHDAGSKVYGKFARGWQLEANHHRFASSKMLRKHSGTKPPNSVKTNPLQKTFIKVDKCAEYITMLHGMIRVTRTRSRSIYVVTLDL